MNIKDAIGQNEKNDFELKPEEHADLYKEVLPELSALLKDSEVEYIGKEYLINDEKAVLTQKKYKDHSRKVRLYGFLTTLFTVGITISGSLKEITLPVIGTLDSETTILIFTILAIISSALAGIYIKLIKSKKLLTKWMEARSEAEESRIGYFDMLAKKMEGKSIDQHLQVLEYFRRYQLDVQLTFYEFKSKALEKKANQSLTIIAILAGVVIIINSIAGLGFGSKYAFLASIAIIIQAYSFMVSNKELDDQNERNAERYSRTRKVMAELKARVDRVKIAIRKNDTSTLAIYFKAVHEPLSIENKQWLKSMNSSTMAIQELEKHIDGIGDTKNE